MGWNVQLNITNNTQYNIDVVNNDAGQVGEIHPNGGKFSWETSDPNNADAITNNSRMYGLDRRIIETIHGFSV